jgi:hypothetical protein
MIENARTLVAGWGAFVLLGLVAFGVSVGTDQPPIEIPRSEDIGNLRDLLTFSAKVEKQHAVVIGTLEDHTERLERLQETVNAGPVIEPPGEPVTQEALLPKGWKVRMLTAEWCTVCKRWKNDHADEFGPGELEYQDSPKGMSLPAFEIIDPDGKVRIRLVGYRTSEQIQKAVNKQATSGGAANLPAGPTVRRGPVMLRDQWGSYRSDNAFHCGQNCPMCDARRARRQREGWQSSMKLGQEPAPREQVDEAIRGLGIGPDSLFADVGCGDGAVLIAAVRATGCRAVGIEIDPVRAAAARDNARDHGVADRIYVITADARTVDLGKLGVTEVFTFLFPDLLRQLGPTLRDYPVAAVYHPIPGRDGTLRNGVYFYGGKS